MPWRWRPLLAAIVAVVALALGVRVRAARQDVYALVGAKVVTVSGPTLDTATVILRDGVIEAVGAEVAVPPDARVIDAKGLTLTPGLIDGFGGVGLPSPPPRSAGGGTASPGPSSPPATALAPQALALEKIRPAEAVKARDAGVTTALVIPREGVLPGQSVLLNLAGDRPDAMAWRQPAALHLHMATLSRQYPGSLMGTVAYARQALYDAARYREEWAAYERSPAGRKRPRYDAGLAAWQGVLAGQQPLVVTANRENDVRRALALADEFKVRLVVAGAPQAFRVAGLIKARKLPLLVTVNFDPPRAPQFGGGDEERERKDIEDAERNPAELHKAGVPFALVSGYARDFVAGVKKAIERGLPREAALRAVTLGAAEALGIADRTGSLETGKAANVVAWSGEPLSKDGKVKLVFVDGHLYEPEERAEKGRAGGEAGAAEREPPETAPEKKPLPSPSPSPVAPPPPPEVRR